MTAEFNKTQQVPNNAAENKVSFSDPETERSQTISTLMTALGTAAALLQEEGNHSDVDARYEQRTKLVWVGDRDGDQHKYYYVYDWFAVGYYVPGQPNIVTKLRRKNPDPEFVPILALTSQTYIILTHKSPNQRDLEMISSQKPKIEQIVLYDRKLKGFAEQAIIELQKNLVLNDQAVIQIEDPLEVKRKIT